MENNAQREVSLVMQNNPCTCGQACVAMLAGVPIEQVIAAMKSDGPTATGMVMDALDHFGIPHAARNTRISKKNPTPAPTSILTVHMPTYRHWVLLHGGKYYDPEFGLLDALHPEGRATSYIAIHWPEK